MATRTACTNTLLTSSTGIRDGFAAKQRLLALSVRATAFEVLVVVLIVAAHVVECTEFWSIIAIRIILIIVIVVVVLLSCVVDATAQMVLEITIAASIRVASASVRVCVN